MENRRITLLKSITLLYELEVFIGEDDPDNHDWCDDLCEEKEYAIVLRAYLDKNKAIKELESWAQKNNAEKSLDTDGLVECGYRAVKVDDECQDDITIVYRWVVDVDLVV